MSSFRVAAVMVGILFLGACSEERLCRGTLGNLGPKNAEIKDFNSIPLDEYAAALDKYAAQFGGRETTAYEEWQKPQYQGATFYSAHIEAVNYYGKTVRQTRYCSLLNDRCDCSVVSQDQPLSELK